MSLDQAQVRYSLAVHIAEPDDTSMGNSNGKIDCSNKYRGCQWQDVSMKLDSHLKNDCDYASMECPYCSKVYYRADYRKHAKEDDLLCKNEKYGCDWTGLCKEQIAHLNNNPTDENERLTGCDYEFIKCASCPTNFWRVHYREHVKQTICCLNYHQGCNWMGLCKDRKTHLNNVDNIEGYDWYHGCDFARIKCIGCGRETERCLLKSELDKTLNEEHLIAVMKLAWEARSKWYEIGLESGLSSGMLDSIRSTNRYIVDECYRDMIKEWLRSSSADRRSLRAISEALRSNVVGYESLAIDVEKGNNLHVQGYF